MSWEGDLPAGVMVPYVPGGCNATRRSGMPYCCTRPAGHGGRHAAAGGRRADGMCQVYAVWSDPCS